ncbi:hypothetical protein BHM03_00002181 [Ensete ventricosum]|nr:hypothetical protein BHM03_00002181 [Ensete ventricosum]
MSLGYAQKLSYREDVGTVGMSEIFDPPDLLQQKVFYFGPLLCKSEKLLIKVDLSVGYTTQFVGVNNLPYWRWERVVMEYKVVAADEGGETKVGEAEGEGTGELDHHVIGTVGGGAREDEVGDSGDEDSQEEEERPKDHYVLRVRLVDAHPPEIGMEAFELVVSVGEAACV